MESIEYRIRPVSRYIVTRHISGATPNGGGHVGSSVVGEFPNRELAQDVARAFAGKHGSVNESILPEHDIPALLRNIAEEAEPAQRGIVVLMDKRGRAEVYGLGTKTGDPHEILDAGAKRLAALDKQ